MTAEHVRAVLDSQRDGESLWRMWEEFGGNARRSFPSFADEQNDSVKQSGGALETVVDDFLLRLVVLTLRPYSVPTDQLMLVHTLQKIRK